MNAADLPDFDAHEDVRIFELDPRGALAIIAIHSTHLGPAVGGCRVWPYRSNAEALTDALRLSRGMSYKNALPHLPFGGGKAVIVLPVGEIDRQAVFGAFGRAVESLNGRYVTAEDVGTCVRDMQVVAEHTTHVGGLPALDGKAGGDPSPWTALGVFESIAAALRFSSGRGLSGARIAVQGAGAVGSDLCGRLVRAGARVTLADTNIGRAQSVAETHGVYLADPADIHRIEADVFAPCALGAGLNRDTIAELGAGIVCGAANNQLADPSMGVALKDRGVLYCPDYVVNSGGIIAVYGESVGQATAELTERMREIPDRLIDILTRARRDDVPPHLVADRIAAARIGRGRNVEAAMVGDARQ